MNSPEKGAALRLGLMSATRYDLDKRLYNGLDSVGLGALVGYVRRELPQVEVVTAETPEEMAALAPHLVGLSSISENYGKAVELAKFLKSRTGAPVIIGGVHISLAPETLDPVFDAGVIGEGEKTLTELLRSVLALGRFPDAAGLRGIQGLCFYSEGRLTVNDPRPYLEDLDEVPMIDRRKMPFWSGKGFVHLVASRGCPYQCSICSSKKLFPTYRSFSPERIMREIRTALTDYGAKEIMFFDDLLIADFRRLKDLVDRIVAEGLAGAAKFLFLARANLVDERLCAQMLRLRTVRVGIGLESFADSVLAYYNKGTTGMMNQTAIDRLAASGIETTGCFVFGSQAEGVPELLTTLRAIYENLSRGKLAEIYWGVLKPYPGTGVCRDAQNRGYRHATSGWDALVNRNYDWERFAAASDEAYINPKMPRAVLIEHLAEWFTKFSLVRPGWGNGCVLPGEPGFARRLGQARESVERRLCGLRPGEPGDSLLAGVNSIS